MTEVLAVFRSRAQAVDCNARLHANGISTVLVNTPKEANIGCGLSIKIPPNMQRRVAFIISNAKYSAFYGFYTVKNLYSKSNSSAI